MTLPVPTIGFTAAMTVGGTALKFPVTIDVPTGEVSTIETSFMGQATRDRTYTTGLWDNGELQCETYYCAADWHRLWGYRGGAAQAVVITFPDDGSGTVATWTFSALLTKMPMKLEKEGIMTIQFTMKVTGAITSA